MPITPDVARTRARYASLTRSKPADDPDLIDARRDLAAATLEAHIGRALAAGPALYPAHLERLRAVLADAAAPAPQTAGPRTFDMGTVIARAAIATLETRAGFDEWWGVLGAECRAEVREAIRDAVNALLRGARFSVPTD